MKNNFSADCQSHSCIGEQLAAGLGSALLLGEIENLKLKIFNFQSQAEPAPNTKKLAE